MVLKLYGFNRASTTQRVAVVAKELGVSYELITVDLTSTTEHKTEAWRNEKNPFGRTPTMFDGEHRIIESRAIAKYLAAKYPEEGSRLVPPPSDLIAYSRFEEAASMELGDFDGPAAVILFERFVKLQFGLGEPDEIAVEKSVQKLKTVLDAYDIILGGQRYIGGDNLTLIDLFHLPRGDRLGKVGIDLLTSYKPNVARWWGEISELDSWKAVQADLSY